MVLTISKTETILFNVLVFLAGLIFVLNITNNEQGITAVFYVTFVIVLALYLLSSKRYFKLRDILAVGIVLLAMINVIVNSLTSDAVASFDYFKKILIFSTTILFMITCTKTPNGCLSLEYLIGMYTLLSAFCVVYYLLHSSSLYDGLHLLYFNLENPNFAGLFLSVFAMSQFAFAVRKITVLRRILHLALGLFCAYLVFETQARNAEISLILYIVVTIVMSLAFLIGNKTVTIPKWLGVIASVFPAAFAFIYIHLVHNPFFQSLFGFFAGVGKGLDARESIWRYALNNVREHPIFGAYYQISNGTGMSQMHNTHIDIMASYGILVMILVCWYLYLLIADGRRYSTIFPMMCILVFIFSITLGMGEAALFSGGQGLYVFISCFLLLSREDTDKLIMERRKYDQRRL